MTLKINGEPVEAVGFLWDDCHKIYIIENEDQRQRMFSRGWGEDDCRPLRELPEAWLETCPLRFISSGDLEREYVEQGTDAEVTWED